MRELDDSEVAAFRSDGVVHIRKLNPIIQQRDTVLKPGQLISDDKVFPLIHHS